MTIFEFSVTYAVCWWLVLFMVLPHQAGAAAQPEPGHARSAPANPQIKRKLRWATVFAIIPAVALYFIVGAAKAEDMYHAGSNNAKSGCTQALPSADLEARDGYSTGGKKVAPATMDNGQTILGQQDHYKIPLLIPSTGYINRTAPNAAAANATTTPTTAATAANNSHNVDLSQSFIGAGTLDIGRDGSAALNGKSIVPQNDPGCDPQTKE